MSRVAIIVFSSLLLVGLIGAVAFGFVAQWRNSNGDARKIDANAKAVQSMCQPTDYKEACYKSLAGVRTDDPKELIKAAFRSTKLELDDVAENSTILMELEKDPVTAEAVRNCRELFKYALDDLQRSFEEIGRMEWNQAEKMIGNLNSWLSASITYQDTCLDGFENTTKDAANKVRKILETTTQMSSNGLAIISDMSSLLGNLDTSALNRRRLLEVKSQRGPLGSAYDEEVKGHDDDRTLPVWLVGGHRRLLDLGAGDLKAKANVVVAKDGSGKYKTIGEAIKDIPKHGNNSFIVYIKQGVYNESVALDMWMTHVVFVGDGPNKTRITHNKNSVDSKKSFDTATLSVLGDFFMAKDIGIENTAGPLKYRAVALRVQSDESIFYNVHIDGYQETLYAHTYRQFFRNCRISGTVDFIFGDAAAFFQNCTFVVRKPLENQTCIVTARGRLERHQSTGIIIHQSKIEADPEYKPLKQKNKAFLGQPSKQYSRTIIMESYIDDHIQPEGWMPLEDEFGLQSCYYGEFNNEGPGSKLDNRAKGRGIRTMTYQQAQKFMPLKFFKDDDWIQNAQTPYEPNLRAPTPSMAPKPDHNNDNDNDKTTGTSSTDAPTSSHSSESSPSSSDDQGQSGDDATGDRPTPSPIDTSADESGHSPGPTSDKRDLSEMTAAHDPKRMLTAHHEEEEVVAADDEKTL